MMKIGFCLVIFSLLMPSCAVKKESSDDIIRVEGPVDSRLEAEFLRAIERSDIVILNSLGGLPSSAFAISDAIMSNNINIIVDDICASACAEHILPASQKSKAQSLKFTNEPIIAFHWNSPILEELMKEEYSSDFEDCPFSDTIKSYDQQKRAGVNNQFWKIVKENLGSDRSEYMLDSQGCPLIKVKFENSFWLPSSKTLQNDFGLVFTGEVCADDKEKCRLRIDRDWRAGSRIVIDDEVYTSKGKL